MADANARDARFEPMLDAIDKAVEPFELLAGEQIYMLAVLLVGSINDAPPDVRELFRDVVIQALAGVEHAGDALAALCLEGEIRSPQQAQRVRSHVEWLERELYKRG